MYAIVDIAGQQFKVEKDQKIFVHRLEGEAGSNVEFGEVLLVDEDGKVSVGTPTIEGATVSARILEHMKGDKVMVFKKKRRKGYQKSNGHRQFLSKIQIEGIVLGGKPKKASRPKKETVAEETPVQESPVTESQAPETQE